MSLLLLKTKLHMPTPHPQVVVRERLLDVLTEGRRLGRQVTLVSAPAGFGKTTLVISWLQGLARGVPSAAQTTDHAADGAAATPDVAWLSLDADDNHLRRFFSYVVAAGAMVRPSLAELQSLLEQTSAPPGLHLSSGEAVDVASLVVPLINAVMASPDPLILVLDDYHEIQDAAVHQALAYLIDHLPEQMHVVIITRADPPLSLARLRTQDRLTEVRADDLRFTLGDADIFFNQMMGLDLVAADVAALERRTEGWVAGLQLAAVSLRGRAPERVKRFIAGFSGTHRHVIDYLVEEVLSQQSAALRLFMTQTSILAQLSAPLCTAVTGQADAAALLRQLEQGNLFVTPLDESRTWYRYHGLLAEFLQSRLCVEQPTAVRDLHLRAATWYETQGMPGQAVDHVLQAGDIERAVALIEQSAQDFLMHGEAVVVLRWVDGLPEGVVRSHPVLAMIYTEALLIAGQVDEIDALLEVVEAGLDQAGAQRDALISQVAAVRAYLAAQHGHVEEGIGLVQQALAHLPSGDGFLQGVVMWLLGLLQYLLGDAGASTDVMDRTIEISQASNNQLIMALSAYVSALMHVLRGNLRTADQVAARAADQLLQRSSGWQAGFSPAVSMTYQALAEIARERNELPAARTHIDQCVKLAEVWGNAEVLTDSYVLQARICEALADFSCMQVAMDKATALADRGEISPLTMRQVRSHQARLQLYRGEIALAERWADAWFKAHAWPKAHGDAALAELRGGVFVQWIEAATAARIALRRGDFATVLRMVTPLLRHVVASGWYGVAIELVALQALAFYGQGDLPAALSALDRAFAWAASEGYVRSFVDLGPPMARLLRQVVAMPAYAAYIKVLQEGLAASAVVRPDWITTPSAATASQVDLLVEPLSDRELEVLAFIADGLTNREIADKLYVAISTVKTHINNLYGKLGVTNRARAVARAADLGLL